MQVLSLLLFVVFIIISAIHANWTFGGKWGLNEALPTNEKGERVLHPKKIDSALVAIALALFGFYYLVVSHIIIVNLPQWTLKYGGWILPSIFILRAAGDFRYVGFFKKIKGTNFGNLDTKYYSPLCLLIAIIGFVIQLLQQV